MNKDFYTNRKDDLLKAIAYFTKSNRLNDARIVYGRLCELIDIAYFYKVLSAEEYHFNNKQAEDCFYNNL